MAIFRKYKKYLSFFKLRFAMGMQYRAAALAGIATQFAWGFMEINVFLAFNSSNSAYFPMNMKEIAAYIWIQQAFLAFWAVWMFEPEIFDCITDGGVGYELCRPTDIYGMWFARSMATRISRAVLRCFPILIVAGFLPEPFRLLPPTDFVQSVFFVISLLLGLSVTVALCMVIYMLTFFVISPQGLRILAVSSVELLEGAVIPLPFFPKKICTVLELLPFASIQNAPLRIYSGNICGDEAVKNLLLQLFWLIALIAAGRLLSKKAVRHTVVQGG